VALKKVKQMAGYSYEYWKIFKISSDMNSGNTCVRLALYKDKDTRDINIQDFITHETFIFNEPEMTRQQAYIKITESNLSVKPNNWDAEHPDEEYTPVELNWFIDAEDC
jgi:hypothetical protein